MDKSNSNDKPKTKMIINIKYNNKTIIKDVCEIYDLYDIYENNARKYVTIKDLFKDLYKDAFQQERTLERTLKNFFICNGKLISADDNIFELFASIASRESLISQNICHLECFNSLQGGGADITEIIGIIFKPIVDPILGIGNVFEFLIQLLVWFGEFVVWFIFFVGWLFSDLLNPVKLMSDFWGSIMLIIVTIFSTFMNVIMGIVGFIVNTVGGWMQGFWGWDQSSLTYNDQNSKYFKGINRAKGKKCYLTNTNTVPFSIILGTILCPPIGVFMDMGLTGWFNIFICGLLTLLFYLPGLFYALLIIYS
jgi:uncharacterized membrane protein YqaE (UPF0057 family)